MMQTKYRSIRDETGQMVTPNNTSSANYYIFQPNGTFWLVAGGAQPHDQAVAVDTFTGDIILRGGITKFVVTNNPNELLSSASDPVRVQIFMVWTNKDPGTATVFPGPFPVNVPTTWDPTVVPEFTRVGKLISRREFLLKGDGESCEVIFKHKVQKIDQAVHITGGGRLFFFVTVNQLSNTEAVPAPETLTWIMSHNLTFTGDAET